LSEQTNQLLKILITLIGRTTFDEEQVKSIVAPNKNQVKQKKAYNLCDGTQTQRQIAKLVGLDEGNFSKTVKKWIEKGILYRVGEGKESKLLHVFPIN